MDTLRHDLRYALRALARGPGFAIAAILTLALGIGANTAIFSVVNAVLLRPLPFEDPDRLVVVWNQNLRSGIERDVTSAPNFLDWKDRNTVFSEMVAYANGFRNLTNTEEPERVPVTLSSGGFFRLLGVEPMLGRGFLEEEHQVGRNRVVVLSHGLWARRFGSDAGIVGETVSLNATPYTVVGVMPPGFSFPEESQAWLPLAFAPDESRGALWLSVLGRLEPGATAEQAQAQMSAIAADMARAYPQLEGTGVLLEPLSEVLVGQIRPALLVLLGAVGFVLLIACVNVANLLFARSAARQREIAVRAALGAARGRVIRQVLTESLLLGVAGGMLGLALAYWGVDALVALAPPDVPRLDLVRVDATVLAFTAAASVATGLLFGLLPALQLSRPDLTSALREGARGATEGVRSGRVRRALVAAEVALALVLLIGAGLMIRSFATLQAVDPGFRADGVLTLRLALPGAKYPEPPRVARFYDELLQGIEALPGVQSASATSTLLLSRLPRQAPVVVEGQEGALAPGAERIEVPFDAVTSGFFQTLGLELLAGRTFATTDAPDAPPVVVVNQAFVERFFPDQDPLGRRIAFGGVPEDEDGWITIVGVVQSARRSGLGQEPRPEAFMHHGQFPLTAMTVVVRTSGDPMRLAGPVREVVRRLDPDQPISEMQTLEKALGGTVATQRFSMLLLSLFSLAAVLLAAIGIYGLVAYGVAQRQREIGVRVALGAGRGDVLRMIVRQAVLQVLPGLAVGLLAAFALTRVLAGLLYGVSATDPLTFAAVALLLSAVTALAGLLPALRATRLDPMQALREG